MAILSWSCNKTCWKWQKPFKTSLQKLKKKKKKKEENYRVPWRVYAFTYTNITKQISLPPYKTDGIENDRKENGLLSVQDTESATEWFDCLTMFYNLNGKFPDTGGHLFVSDGETPPGIVCKKLDLKEHFAKFIRTKSSCLVSSPFLAAILLFPYNDLILEFNALKDLCQNCIRLANSIFANHESKTWHEKTGKRNKPKNMLTRRSISLIMILLKKKKMMIKKFFPIFLLKKKVIFLMIMMMF